MAGYIIHMAIAKLYLERHLKEDDNRFYQGVIAPDLLKKPDSHYGPSTSCPGLQKFEQIFSLKTSFHRGYYMHLKTDLLFYKELITPEIFSKEIYKDYDRLNKFLIERYRIRIPKEIQTKIAFERGMPKILQESAVIDFIENVARLELKEVP